MKRLSYILFILGFIFSAIISGVSVGYLINFVKNKNTLSPEISEIELYFLKEELYFRLPKIEAMKIESCAKQKALEYFNTQNKHNKREVL